MAAETAPQSTAPAVLLRNRPGIRHEEWCQWPEVALEDMDSTFSGQQFLQSLIRKDPSDVDAIVRLPDTQDEDTWQYEQLRQVCLELNNLIVLLEPDCTPEKCPEMKADEWMYLCAAHATPQTCSAIDYSVHTLDHSIALLNSHKYFPSRVTVPESSIKHFQNIARRLYRIFAHAYYHHRELFSEFEIESHLYARFLSFSKHFKLIPEKLIIIPPDAIITRLDD
ncbi:hypothetical protein HK097_003493 [Rhizophlyctis rosea]|uniref:Mob1/phocein n=1 Tax=Rhizophlyctis rosea TaxID=64517 RepID=A0AAD5S2J3_9FUNG|nr:hypothetical protein HK097_003493 [Rhizophlyctis rosea]